MEISRPIERTPVLLFLVGDTVALLLFVFIGERDHGIADAQPLLRWLITTSYFLLPWLVAAGLLGAYQFTESATIRSVFSRSLTTWFVAVPLGALLRSFANGSGVIPSTFLVVTLVVGGVFVVGWRVVFTWLRSKLVMRSKVDANAAPPRSG